MPTMKKILPILSLLFLAIIIFVSSSFISPKEPIKLENKIATSIEWLTWEQAMERNKTVPKKLFVDVYTDWCGWCKKMDAGTFTDPEVVKYMSDNYYSIKLDAERKEKLIFKGDTFKYVANGRRGIHQFAATLLDNKMSYPSFVALNEKAQRITVIPGYMEAHQILPILNYIGEEKYLTTKYEDFIKTWAK
jgi:thioredoxin-related protein